MNLNSDSNRSSEIIKQSWWCWTGEDETLRNSDRNGMEQVRAKFWFGIDLTGGTSLTHGRFPEDVGGRKIRRTDSLSPSPSPSPVPSPVLSALSVNENLPFSIAGLSHSAVANLASSLVNLAAIHGGGVPASGGSSKLSQKSSGDSSIREPPALTALHSTVDANDADDSIQKKLSTGTVSGPLPSHSGESRRTTWKCKRCVFK